MPDKTIGEITERLKTECSNYDQTVQAIKALAHELMWDDLAQGIDIHIVPYVGRRMNTSSANRISPGRLVTPDLVVNYPSRFGIIAEAKLSFSQNEQQRKGKIRELQKYDDDLIGWHTPDGRVNIHDILLIVHHFHGKRIENQVKGLLGKKEIKFDRNFALICFGVVEQEQTWISLEMLYGSLSNKKKQQKLEQRLPIALEYIAGNPSFKQVQLYDSPPPNPLLMHHIHELIWNQLSHEENRQLRESGEVRKKINIGALREELSKTIGPGEGEARIPEIPKSQWVRNALELFVRMKWAETQEDNQQTYVYIVKERKNVLDQFIKICAKQQARMKEKNKKESKKLPLFANQINGEEDDL